VCERNCKGEAPKLRIGQYHQRDVMEPIGDVLHLLVILSLLETCNAKVGDFKAAGATAPGDIIIGGLFAIHEGVEESANLSAPHASQCAR
jgi:hypothetical protein